MSFSKLSSTVSRAARRKVKAGENEDDPLIVRRMRHALNGSFAPFPRRIRTDFRASSLPFCPILYIDGTRKNDIGWLDTPSVGWKDQFYFDIGTAAHTLWQRVLTRAAREAPMQVKPFGSWKCTHCGNEKKNCFLPEPCQCGPHKDGTYTLGEFALLHRKDNPWLTDYTIKNLFDTWGPYSEWEYVEIEFEYNGLTGHVDYIEYYPQLDLWAIWDLKTAMSKAVNSPTNELPVIKNVLQIEAYSYILPKVYPKLIPRIDEYALLYHTRESATLWEPYRVEWDAEREERAGKRVARWVNGYKTAQKYLKKPDMANLQEVVNTRPCLSEKSYDREMACKFEYGASCEFYRICTQHEGNTLTKRLLVSLDNSLNEHRKAFAKQNLE